MGETILLVRKADPSNPKPLSWAYPGKGDLEFLTRARREADKRRGRSKEQLLRQVLSGNNRRRWPFLAILLIHTLRQTEREAQRTTSRCRFRVVVTRLDRDNMFLEVDNNPHLRLHFFAIVQTAAGTDLCDLNQPTQRDGPDHLASRLRRHGFRPSQLSFLVQIDTTSVDDGFQRIATVFEASRVPTARVLQEAAAA
ncbi:hypothetical protein HY224_03405 [Candidatus Uhrbacteria bacterium]|nr:hypothetical protein [Candidatus Uhrbacteria bacterium]